MRHPLSAKNLSVALLICTLMTSCATHQTPNSRAPLTREQAKELVAVYLYWEPANPWQRFSGAGRGVIYENNIELGSLKYGQHALIFTKPGRKAYLVKVSDTYSFDEATASKIVLDFEAVSAGSELTIVFSQDRNRASGALAKPRVEVIGTVPDAIRNSAQAFAHLPKLK